MGYLYNWTASGKGFFSAVERTSTEEWRDAQNLIIHLFCWLWSIDDLDKRLPVNFKNHVDYFRLAQFNFLVTYYLSNYCNLVLTCYVIIAQSNMINKMQNQKEKAILVPISFQKLFKSRKK